jgi:hypothetical protein
MVWFFDALTHHRIIYTAPLDGSLLQRTDLALQREELRLHGKSWRARKNS